MKNHDKKKRLLIVDDHPVELKGFANALSKKYGVATAGSVEEANALMISSRFDCALLDVFLGGDVNGFELADWYRALDPIMAILLVTAYPLSYFKNAGTAIDSYLDKDKLSKSIESGALDYAIDNAIWRRTMPHHLKQKRFAVLQHIMPHLKAVRFASRTGDDSGAERIDFLLVENDVPVAGAMDVYNVPTSIERKNRHIISIASCVGCGGGCRFCGSGNRRLEGPYTLSALVAQVILGLDSYHAKGALEEGKKVYINFTAEGDSLVYNPKNTFQAIDLLSRQQGLDLSYIITTTGSVKNLAIFREEYSHLPVTFYWSVITLKQDLRPWLMPGVSQALVELRDAFQQTAELTKTTITASWTLIKGMNDGDDDIDDIVEYFKNRPFEIKIMALEDGTLVGAEKTTEADVDRFMEKLRAKGIPCRKREIVGGKIKAGCGTTVPVDISFL